MQSGEVQQHNSFDKVLEQRKKIAPNGCLPYAWLLRKYGKSLFESEKSSKILSIEAAYNCSNDENREIIFQKCCDVFSFISPFTDVIDALKNDFHAYSPQWQGILNIDFEDYILHSTSIKSDNDRKFLLFANRFTEFYFRSIAPAIDFTKAVQNTEKQQDNYALTPRELKYFQRAISEGYMQQNADGTYRWLLCTNGNRGKRVSATYFFARLYENKTFAAKKIERLFPNLKRMSQSFNDYNNNKFDKKPDWTKQIDEKIFND